MNDIFCGDFLKNILKLFVLILFEVYAYIEPSTFNLCKLSNFGDLPMAGLIS